MTELKNKYPSIKKDGSLSYGGSQLWSRRENMRLCGCGVIACADMLIYVSRNNPELGIPVYFPGNANSPISQEDYETFTDGLSPRYLPLIPRFGINGIAMALGMNSYFRRNNIALHARWGVRRDILFDKIEEMLARDIPVILSIGPNFPLLWRKERVNFYTLAADGQYHNSTGAFAHYVTVTGYDGERLKISSWGRKYYIEREEFQQYAVKYSAPLLSNILYIENT